MELFLVKCPECAHEQEIDGNELEIICEECGLKGDQNDFEDAE